MPLDALAARGTLGDVERALLLRVNRYAALRIHIGEREERGVLAILERGRIGRPAEVNLGDNWAIRRPGCATAAAGRPP